MATNFGRPQIVISFKSRATTAITRSGSGVGAMILNDEKAADKVTTYTITDYTEIPENKLSEKGIVANIDADSYGVINFTTGNIRVVNSEYTDALLEAEGIAENISEDIPQYLTYTAAEYTARFV